MNITIKKIAAAAMLTSVAAPPALADDFTPTTQLGDVNSAVEQVSGHKVDRHTPVINPTPHEVSYPVAGTLDVSRGYRFNDRGGALADCASLLPAGDKGVKLNIEYGRSKAAKAGVSMTPGAYRLEIGKRGINITGFDADGAFYALQTLSQIHRQSDGSIGCCVINDRPDLPTRGVIEGFYGTPWSHEARLSLIDMFGRNKLNTYVYGPKDDPYHSSPNWRKPYPADQAEQIRELCDAAHRARVKFVWAIHPGKDIRWDKADYDSLLNKFSAMYDLGVRGFALFFDDIEGIGANPARQAALVNDLTRDFVRVKGDVAPIMICPTDYSQLWANPGENGTLAVYGRELEPDVDVFWTGAAVCSDLTPETLDFVDSRIKRPAMYWWNFPVTDYCTNLVLQGPVYGLDTTLTSEQVRGVMSNPMEHAEASKLAMYSVADYTWNVGGYNPLDSWERALVEQMPGAPGAYRTFAIHSADTENGYRRAESWETETFAFDDYTPGQFEALRAEFDRIAKAPAEMRARGGNDKLVAEIDPWLTQFEELGRRGLRTLDLIKSYEHDNDSVFWSRYAANLMTAAQRADYEAHKSGISHLQPFYEAAMEGMIDNRYLSIAGEMPAIFTGVGTYTNLRGPVNRRLMVDNDTATYYHTMLRQRDGDWIGLDLRRERPVDEVHLLQGRHDGDTDCYDLAILETSVDGHEWTALGDTIRNSYDIDYIGEPVSARYVRLRRLPESTNRSWVAIREFQVNPVTPDRIGCNVTIENGDINSAMAAFDGNPDSSFALDGAALGFDRRERAGRLVLLLGSGVNAMTVIQSDADGNQVASTEVNTPYADIILDAATHRITVTGRGVIHELIQR